MEKTIQIETTYSHQGGEKKDCTHKSLVIDEFHNNWNALGIYEINNIVFSLKKVFDKNKIKMFQIFASLNRHTSTNKTKLILLPNLSYLKESFPLINS